MSWLEKDQGSIDAILKAGLEQGLDFLGKLNEIPMTNEHVPSPPELIEGKGSLAALDEFMNRLYPLIAPSTGPRYWGFVTGGATPASLLGDLLTMMFDQHGMRESSKIETEAIQLLLKLLNLPSDFGGGFVSGATMSNFSCLGAARQWYGRQVGKDFARDGMSGGIKIYACTPHSSILKCLSMLGIGSRNITLVPAKPGNREAIDVEKLEGLLNVDEPFILISSAGTVNTADFDDLEAISKLKQKFNFWWHVDAAFAGLVACSPKYSHLVKGWEMADSITLDGHKWLNVPYECGFYLVKSKHERLQVETFQNSNAPYLGNQTFQYLNMHPENSRRLKGISVWFTLKAYGTDGYQSVVENSVKMAQVFTKFIEVEPALNLLAPTHLNNVCFELKRGSTTQFLDRLLKLRTIFVSPTVFLGRQGIRASFVNWRTSESDIDLAISEIKALMNCRGVDVQCDTKCAHWHSELDIIGIKFKCCNEFYACHSCHTEVADHSSTRWSLATESDTQAILCGICKSVLTITEYMDCENVCPHCNSRFNPGCKLHYDLYFE